MRSAAESDGPPKLLLPTRGSKSGNVSLPWGPTLWLSCNPGCLEQTDSKAADSPLSGKEQEMGLPEILEGLPSKTLERPGTSPGEEGPTKAPETKAPSYKEVQVHSYQKQGPRLCVPMLPLPGTLPCMQ